MPDLTRRQVLLGAVALPAVLALKQGRAHDWAIDGDFCKRCGVPSQVVVDDKWPKTCGEPYRYFVGWDLASQPSRTARMYFDGYEWHAYA